MNSEQGILSAAKLLFAAAEETEHALAVSAAELRRAQHASREHARELQVARRAASSLVELECRQAELVAAAERNGLRASGLTQRAEESSCWASRAMAASPEGTAHLEIEVRLAIAAPHPNPDPDPNANPNPNQVRLAIAAARRAAMLERDAAVAALGEARHAAQEVRHAPDASLAPTFDALQALCSNPRCVPPPL